MGRYCNNVRLASHIFTNDMMRSVVDKYKEYAETVDKRITVYRESANARLVVVNNEIANIVSVVATTGSHALNEKLAILEAEKAELIKGINNIETEMDSSNISEQKIKAAFKKAKKMFLQGSLSNNKKLIDNYVDKIIIYKDRIEIRFNLGTINPQGPNGRGDFNVSDLFVLREERAQVKPGLQHKL